MLDTRRGIVYGILAYVMWGLFPLYWPLLRPAGAVEILAHRIAWSLVAVIAILATRRHFSWVRPLLQQPRKLALLALAAGLVSVNWCTYIFAVNSGHVVEASLGYFINPLVSVLFGVVVFRERLRPFQWAAVALGTLAVLILTLAHGRLPWIAIVLAVSFGIYGLIKKIVHMGAAESLAVETLILFAPAFGYLVFLEHRGRAAFGHQGATQAALLAAAGVITAVPLMFFTAAAIRVPLSMLGLLQYIAPTLQFLCGILVAHERMPANRWIGFLVVWGALAVFSWDALRAARGALATRRSAVAGTEPV
jgi:chloramphenicol-sensitive protein RarD